MREIKFRVFNKYGMSKPINIWEMTRCEEAGVEYPEETIFMQYTGLKDKNGKEIYEGDIVLLEVRRYDPYIEEDISDLYKTTVTFDSGSFWLSGEGISVNSHFHYNNDDREVIGNIHETPKG